MGDRKPNVFPRYRESVVLEDASVRVVDRDGDWFTGQVLEVNELGLVLRLQMCGDEVFFPWPAVTQVAADAEAAS